MIWSIFFLFIKLLYYQMENQKEFAKYTFNKIGSIMWVDSIMALRINSIAP